MQEELANSNHKFSEVATAVSAVVRVHCDAAEALAAVCGPDLLIATGEDCRRINADLCELRRFRELADKRWLEGHARMADEKPRRAWRVPEMAKQLGLSEGAVRRRARSWPFSYCATHANCLRGTRGCDLRFVASEASAWVARQRTAQMGARR